MVSLLVAGAEEWTDKVSNYGDTEAKIWMSVCTEKIFYIIHDNF